MVNKFDFDDGFPVIVAISEKPRKKHLSAKKWRNMKSTALALLNDWEQSVTSDNKSGDTTKLFALKNFLHRRDQDGIRPTSLGLDSKRVAEAKKHFPAIPAEAAKPIRGKEAKGNKKETCPRVKQQSQNRSSYRRAA